MPEPVTGTLLAIAVAKAFGISGGKEFARRVADLAGLVDAQKKLLAAIQRDVKALVEGPQRTALIRIGDAADAHSPEAQRERLEQARLALDEAAAQETDPLRESYAWALSAAVWFALQPDESTIITKHLRRAHDAAVVAATQMGDPAVKSARAVRFLASPFRVGIPGVLGPISFKRRPKSIRISTVSVLRAPRAGAVRIDQYGATKAARERERTLVDVHQYVRGLRELLIARGEPADRLPLHRPRLVHGGSVESPGWPKTVATFWALEYEQLPGGEEADAGDGSSALSDQRSGRQLWHRPRKSNEWMPWKMTD
jgi:hypothetical protein